MTRTVEDLATGVLAAWNIPDHKIVELCDAVLGHATQKVGAVRLLSREIWEHSNGKAERYETERLTRDVLRKCIDEQFVPVELPVKTLRYYVWDIHGFSQAKDGPPNRREVTSTDDWNEIEIRMTLHARIPR